MQRKKATMPGGEVELQERQRKTGEGRETTLEKMICSVTLREFLEQEVAL